MNPLLPSMPTTVACLLTGPQRAAIATVGLRGAEAMAMIGRYFSPATMNPIKVGEVRYGRWQDSLAKGEAVASETGESIIVTRNLADSTFTTLGVARLSKDVIADEPYDRWEIHCHGGEAASRRVLADLELAGATVIDQDGWQQALGLSPNERAGLRLLTETTTPRTATIVLDQLRGAMVRFASQSIGDLLTGGAEAIVAIQSQALAILEFTDIGLHLTKPWSVVLAGSPNVGKSSLINALVGYQRSIAFDQPGTTRDVLHADAVIDGWPIRLSDTAGLRLDPSGEIEREGISRALNSIRQSDLVVWVQEASEHPMIRVHGGCDEFSDLLPPGSLVKQLKVFNKCDLSTYRPNVGADGLVYTSATTGFGIESLRQLIRTRLIPVVPPPGTPIPISQMQIDCLRSLVATTDLKQVEEHLNRLLR